MPEVERIGVGDDVFAYVVRAGDPPPETTFVTPNEANLQVGFIVKGPDDIVPRHDHHPVERTIVGTAEVLVVRQGGGEMEIYDADRNFVAKRTISTGDVIVLLEGGHGFRFDSDTVLLEVKQGPYSGVDEKERF